MKKQILPIIVTLIFTLFTYSGFSQVPPPPPGDHGQTGNQPGGNAPVGGGLFILLGLGAAYGVKKYQNVKKLTPDS